MKNYIAYYRVSTQRQGQSGLGLDAQKAIVQNNVGDGVVVNEYIEIESGKKDDRPQLQEALSECKAKNAILIIAKLDRLARSVSFIFDLKESGVEFQACDIPQANTLNLGIMATMAQYEREIISERTKAALAAKKAQGFKLGSPQNLTDKARQRSIEVRRAKAKANKNNSTAAALVKVLRDNGLSLNAIAKQLNDNGYKTSTGKAFTHKQVTNLLKTYQS